jgi:hypothetical protein
MNFVHLCMLAKSALLPGRIQTFNVGNEVKMQVRELLVFPGVDDQPVSQEMIFGYNGLHAGDQVSQERVRRQQIRKGMQFFFWKEQHVKGVGWPGVVECQQGIRLTQAFCRDDKTHVGKGPAGQEVSRRGVQELVDQVHEGPVALFYNDQGEKKSEYNYLLEDLAK